MRDLRELDKYRDHQMEKLLFGDSPTEEHYKNGGCFWIPAKGTRKGLKVIASSGRIEISKGWDHVSISLPNRTPTWEEMDKVKRLFFLPHETAFQYHPEESDHISNHNFCLHIWNNLNQPCPVPPPEMVGNTKLGNIKIGSLTIEQVRNEQRKAGIAMAGEQHFGRTKDVSFS